MLRLVKIMLKRTKNLLRLLTKNDCLKRHYYNLNVTPNINNRDELNNWNCVLKEAENIVGYPTSFLNLRWLLNDEFANVAIHIRKLIGTNHPLLKTAKNLILQNDTPCFGLIVLLVSKMGGLKSNFPEIDHDISSGILHSQRVLAEVTEMVKMSYLIHKALIHINESTTHDENSLHFGNKIALLSGDYLLSNAFRDMANLRNQEVSELISTAQRDLVEAEFLGDRDQQNRPLPNKPQESHQNTQASYQKTLESHQKIPESHQKIPESHQKIPQSHQNTAENHQNTPENHQSTPENHQNTPESHQNTSEFYETLPDEFEDEPYKYKQLLNNPKNEWIMRCLLSGGSLLAKSCSSALKLAGHSKNVQNNGHLVGKYFALTFQAKYDRNIFLNNNFEDFSLINAPLLFHLEHNPKCYDEMIAIGMKNVDDIDYNRLRRVVLSGPGLERTQMLQEEFAQKALDVISGFPENKAKHALVSLAEELRRS